MSRWNCDCRDEGRDAARHNRTWEVSEHRYGDRECDREFMEGYRAEQRRIEDQRAEREAEERAEEQQHRAYIAEQQQAEYEAMVQAEQDQYYASLEAEHYAELAKQQDEEGEIA